MRFIKKPLHFIMVTLAFVATTATFAQDKVSEKELTDFANAYMEIQMVNEKAQTEMVKVIEDSGMKIETFNVIYETSQNPNTTMPAEITEADTKKFEIVVMEIEKMQPVFQKEMEGAISDNNLTIERYQQVVTILQTDPELQQKLQSKMQQQ